MSLSSIFSGLSLFALGAGAVGVSSWRLHHPVPSTTTYKVICSALALFAGTSLTTIFMVPPFVRANIIVLAVLLNLLWRPVRYAVRFLLSFNAVRKRLGVGQHETFLVLFLTVLLLVFCLEFTGPFLSEESSDSLLETSDELAQLWFEGIPIVDPLFSAYAILFVYVFGPSKLFFLQLIPLCISWWAVEWIYWIYSDFNRFLDLGRGGSPPTMRGWATARWREWFANVAVFSPPRVDPMADPYRGKLFELPQRVGPRPLIEGVTPQRVTSMRAPPGTTLQLQDMMADVIEHQFDDAALDPNNNDIAAAGHLFDINASYLERGLPAIRRNLGNALNPDDIRIAEIDPDDLGDANKPRSFYTRNEFGGEVFHPHRDGTSHVVLHPEDVRVVLESGWGERHPFCSESFYWRFYWTNFLNLRLPVPPGLMILYPPRHQGEFDVTRTIIEAAIWHESQGALFPLRADTEPIRPDPAVAQQGAADN